MNKVLISQERTAEVFDIGDNQVLKLFRKNFPVQAVENEAKIANAINDCNLPIPKFFGRVEQEGRIGLIYENIHGVSMLHRIMAKPGAFFKYAQEMAEIHATINQTKVEGIPRQKERLEFFIRRSNELSNDMKETIIRELRQLNDGNYLCHGDLHPDNILYSSVGDPVVIDWMTATAGNPVGDVARTKVILKYSKAPSYLPFVTRVISNTFKSILCKAYISHCIGKTGIEPSEIKAWELPVAAARLYENGPKEEKEALLKFIHKRLKSSQLL